VTENGDICVKLTNALQISNEHGTNLAQREAQSRPTGAKSCNIHETQLNWAPLSQGAALCDRNLTRLEATPYNISIKFVTGLHLELPRMARQVLDTTSKRCRQGVSQPPTHLATRHAQLAGTSHRNLLITGCRCEVTEPPRPGQPQRLMPRPADRGMGRQDRENRIWKLVETARVSRSSKKVIRHHEKA
jgi:hypothetical protein